MNASTRDDINRANAANSTGPKTIEGKQRAAMNALKHGLTGQRLILQPEEHEAYRELTESLHAELAPKTTMELQLVLKIIDTHMRLNRVAVLDNNMLNFGLIENLPVGKDGAVRHDDDTEIAQAQACSWIAQQMSFEKLGRYEGRLSRQLLAYTKELERLQALRIKQEEAQRFDLLSQASLTRGATSMREALARHKARMGAGQTTQPTQTTPPDFPVATGKGQDLSPQNSTAQQSPWSSGSFGNTSGPGPQSPPPEPANDAPREAA